MLYLYTVNGRLIKSMDAAEKLEALLVSNDTRFLLTGGSKGSVSLRWLHSLEVWWGVGCGVDVVVYGCGGLWMWWFVVGM